MPTTAHHSRDDSAIFNLPEDVLRYLLSHFTVPTLIRLRSTSHLADLHVTNELRHRYTSVLSGFVDDVAGFRSELTSSGALVSGSAAVSVSGTCRFTPADLDVYAPKANFFHVIGYLTTIERYEITTYSRAYDHDGIKTVIGLARSEVRIDVVQSASDSVTLPIFNFWATPVMTYLTGTGISIPYPSLLEEQLGLLNPNRSDITMTTAATQGLLRKYEVLGFRFRPQRSERAFLNTRPTVRCSGERSACCPLTVRWHGDDFTLSTEFVLCGTRTQYVATVGERSPEWTTVWWRGGLTCPGTCDQATVYVEPGVYTHLSDAIL